MSKFNKNNLLKIFMTFVLLLKQGLSFANEVGNGGLGYLVNDKDAVLLDFHEEGVNRDPYLSEDVQDPSMEWIHKRLAVVLKKFGEKPVEILARKLSHIYSVDQKLGLLLLRGFEFFRWKPSIESLNYTWDADTPLKLDPSKYLQIAYRKQNSIHIQMHYYFDYLISDAHRAGLLLHEIVYTFMPLIDEKVPQNWANKVTPKYQSSYSTRNIVGYLFSDEFKNFRHDQFARLFPRSMYGDLSKSVVEVDVSTNSQPDLVFMTKKHAIFSAEVKSNESREKVEFSEATTRKELVSRIDKACFDQPYHGVTSSTRMFRPRVRAIAGMFSIKAVEYVDAANNLRSQLDVSTIAGYVYDGDEAINLTKIVSADVDSARISNTDCTKRMMDDVILPVYKRFFGHLPE